MKRIGNRQVDSYLTHYTNEQGYQAIMETGEILPSIGAKNARYGAGQYFTDIKPSELTIGQASRKLYGVPWNTSKLTYQITIDVTNLNVIHNAPNNFLIPGQSPLNISGRIINSGPTVFKIKF